MKTGRFTLAFAYLRLSNEEAQGGESSSITNQRMIVQNYCKQNNITLVREFVRSEEHTSELQSQR